MFNNKTKLHLAIAWTLAFVFAISTIVLAVQLSKKDEQNYKSIDNVVVADTDSIGYRFFKMSDGYIMTTGFSNGLPDGSTSTATPMSTRAISGSSFDFGVTGTYDVTLNYQNAEDGRYGDQIFSWIMYFNGVEVASSWGESGWFYVQFEEHDYTLADNSATVTFDTLLARGMQPDTNYTVTLTYYLANWDDQDEEWEVTQSWQSSTVTLGTWSYTIGEELPEAPTKVGYTFSGWFTDEACTQPYTDDKIYGNITLYAGFVANNYTINFNANGGQGSIAALSMTYDTAKALPSNTFSKAGFYFAGWATSANGSVAYANGASVTNLTSEANGSVTLYAVWSELKYNIAFNSNGGSGSMSSLSVTGLNSVKLTPNAFVKEGYTFRGWATSPNGVVAYADGSNVSSLTSSNGSTVTLYAVWQLNVYDVIFVANDENVASYKVSHGHSSSVPDVAPTKEGHSFVGWVLPDGTPYNGQQITSNTIITADFVADKLVVTFIIDGEATLVYIDWGTNLKELLDEHYPVLLYERPEVEENF